MTKLIPMMVGAIKELSAKVEGIENAIISSDYVEYTK